VGKTFLVTTWRLTDALLMFTDIKVTKKTLDRRETILITARRRQKKALKKFLPCGASGKSDSSGSNLSESAGIALEQRVILASID
jgi:hypothetical protein